jgi:hypothetical protein
MSMADPFKNWASVQSAALEGWANSVQHMFSCWQHCFDVQQHFLRESRKRSHVEISDGPSLTDKYGKRSHDIDPERDV